MSERREAEQIYNCMKHGEWKQFLINHFFENLTIPFSIIKSIPD